MIDKGTLGWLIECIDTCPTYECTLAIIESLEFLYMIDKDEETFKRLMDRVINRQKLL